MEYFVPTGKAMWATGARGEHADLQPDGNFVLYNKLGHNSADGVWSSGTHGHPGTTLRLQNDGNLVLYKADNSGAVWATNTNSNIGKVIETEIVLAAISLSGERQKLIKQYIKDGDFPKITEQQLTDYVNRTQTRITRSHSGGILKLRGELGIDLGVLNLGLSASYIADLNSGDYIAKVGYKVKIPYLGGPEGELTLASRGNPNASAGELKIEIVTSLPASSAAAASAARLGVANSSAVASKLSGKKSAAPAVASKSSVTRSAVLPGSAKATAYISSAPKAAVPNVIATIDPTALATGWQKSLAAPTGSIQGVTILPSSNSAKISYTVDSLLGGDVAIFVDTKPSGFQGQQIDPGLFAAKGLQSFNWDDVADSLPANYQAGQKLYFYLQIDDGVHDPVHSKYSAAVTLPDFHPVITVPGGQTAMLHSPLVFSKTTGNAIRISDPIEKINPVDPTNADMNKLTVILDTTGQGNLKLGSVNSGVTVVGDGSEEMILTGKASDINRVLEGLSYTPMHDAKSDTITVKVRRANSTFLDLYVSSSIKITTKDLRATGLSNHGIKPDGKMHAAFSNIVLKDAVSESIKSVSVSIDHYHAGTDFLALSSIGIQDLLNEGIGATFNAKTGVLTFTGGSIVLLHAQRLLRVVTFSTTDPSPAKGLTLSLQDEFNDVETASEITK